MDQCRICLSKTLYKQLSDIKSLAGGMIVYGPQMFLMCIDVEPAMDDHQLCAKCYKKLINFYSLKALAKRNNHYFESKLRDNFNQDYDIKIESSEVKLELSEDADNKQTPTYLNFTNCDDIDVFDNADEMNNLNCAVELNGEHFHESNFVKKEVLLDIEKNNEMVHYLDDVKKKNTIQRKRGRPKIKDPKLKRGKNNKPEMCSICGKIVAQLREHLKSHLPITERRQIQCKLCPRTFLTYTARNRHTKIKHLGKRSHCTICNKDLVDLRSHMVLIHNTTELSFVCMVCERRFISKTVLADHMNIHTNTKPYECDECGKAFRVKALLITHIKIVHLKQKSHLCQYCSKSFFTSDHLRMHLRTHTKEKPHPCKECGKCFRTTGQRNVHQLRHTKIKNYKCPYCDMAFYNNGARQTHIYTHTKERKHKCQYCEMKFMRSDHRKRHERTAHEKHLIQ